jgi:tripartite-type tricarboxylate transporter receptor subunit TctC
VPTTAEAGLPDFAAGALAGVYVAGRTPAAIVQKLNSVINTIVMQPDVNAQLRRQGGAVEPRSVEALTQWYRAEIAKWKDIVARAGIPPVD